MKTGRMEDVAFASGPLSPGVLAGDGTAAYPLNPPEAEFVKVAGTVKDTALRKPRPLLDEAVIGVPGISGLLDAWARPADGCVREYMTDDESVVVAVIPTDVRDEMVLALGGAMHLVQIVEVEVRVTVEITDVTFSTA